MNIKIYSDRLDHYLEIGAVVATIAGAMNDYNSLRRGNVYRAKGGGFTTNFDRADEDGGVVAEWSDKVPRARRKR